VCVSGHFVPVCVCVGSIYVGAPSVERVGMINWYYVDHSKGEFVQPDKFNSQVCVHCLCVGTVVCVLHFCVCALYVCVWALYVCVWAMYVCVWALYVCVWALYVCVWALYVCVWPLEFVQVAGLM